MASENNFQTTVDSLFKGMNSFITTKTVVGDAIHIGDTIILPLVDVSFGIGAAAKAEDKKNGGGGGMGGKMNSQRNSGDPKWNNEACECKESGWTHEDSGYGSRFREPFRRQREKLLGGGDKGGSRGCRRYFFRVMW